MICNRVKSECPAGGCFDRGGSHQPEQTSRLFVTWLFLDIFIFFLLRIFCFLSRRTIIDGALYAKPCDLLVRPPMQNPTDSQSGTSRRVLSAFVFEKKVTQVGGDKYTQREKKRHACSWEKDFSYEYGAALEATPVYGGVHALFAILHLSWSCYWNANLIVTLPHFY